MTRTYKVNGKEIVLSTVSAIFVPEDITEHTYVRTGIKLHDVDDEFHDGDCVTFEYDYLPEDDEEAEDWINNTCSWISDYTTMDTVQEI